MLQRKGVSVGSSQKYKITAYSEILGERWYFRVVNPIGDFSYAILDTIRFYLTKGRPILEYDVSQKEDGTLDFIPMHIEQSHSLVFTFVRGDGNKNDLVKCTMS